MIRVYFDSDVINKIHAGQLPEILSVIDQHRDKLLIPFSSAHISDKLPSKLVNEELFWRDLDYITEFTQSKYIQFDNTLSITRPHITDTRAVLKNIEQHNELIEECSSINNIVNFMKETETELGTTDFSDTITSLLNTKFDDESGTFGEKIQEAADSIFGLRKSSKYKDSRDLIQQHIPLPKHASNWRGDVIHEMDQYIKNAGFYESFHDMVESSFPDKSKIDRFSYYTHAYYLLGTLGYRPDEINVNKNKGFDNHLQDSIHSFYGAHCDFFVVMDKRLKAKSQVLYEKYKIGTKIIGPEEISKILEDDEQLDEVIVSAIKAGPIDDLEEDGINKSLYRLNKYLFNYFTHIQLEVGKNKDEHNMTRFLFAKMYDNYSDFIFYQEFESVIKNVHGYFVGNEHLDAVLNKFKSENKDDNYYEYFFNEGIAKFDFVNNKFYLSLYIMGNEQATD